MSEVSFFKPRFYFIHWPDNNWELLRYLKAFLDTGTLGTPKAQNVREECKKIKGAAKIAAAVSPFWGFVANIELTIHFVSHSHPIPW